MTPFRFERLIVALEGAPDVVDGLLDYKELDDPLWDFRPYAERFTLREIVAHLADLEEVWIDKFVRTRQTDRTEFERFDTSQKVMDNNYAASNPKERCAVYRSRREELASILKSFAGEDWGKVAVNPLPLGEITLEDQANFVVVHDGYHTGQIAQWIRLGNRN
jgi:uncharacterized damage-inducible protein DinB